MSAVPRRVEFGTHKARPKYNNRRVEIEGEKFDSQREGNRWQQLRLLQRAEVIKDLKRQVPYRLTANGYHLCTYKADFVYLEYGHGEWFEVVEDSKGMITPMYRLKKKLMKALLGIEIRES